MMNQDNNTVNLSDDTDVGPFALDHPEWGDEVARNKDQSVMHPMDINVTLAWILGTFCVFGFPLNFEIIIHILYDKAMRLNPRYIIQLAIAFSDLMLLFTNVIIIADFCFGPNEILCNVFVTFFMGVPYNCFILNYFLSLIDCFVAIAFPLWHRVYVTPQLVVHGLIGLNLIMAFAVEWPIISRIVPIRCAVQWAHGAVINGIWPVVFVLSLSFCCIDFGITWFHIRRSANSFILSAAATPIKFPIIIISSPSPDVTPAVDHSDHPSIDEGGIIEIRISLNDQYDNEATIGKLVPATDESSMKPSPDDPSTINPPLDIEIDEMATRPSYRRLSAGISKEREGDEEITSAKGEEETGSMDITDSGDSGSSEGDAFGAIRPEVSCVPFNRNEWKTIKMFLIGVTPLFLIPFPLLFFYIIYHLTCKYFNFFEQCNDLSWLIPYMFFLLLSLHSLVNPITSLWLNKEFKRPSPVRRRRMQFIPYF